MTYCTAQNLIDRFSLQELVQMTNPTDGTATTVNMTVLNAAIADATAEIDGYLTAYLPLATIPANLVRIACDIARYYLSADQMLPQVEARYKLVIDYLTKVATGKISLAPDSAGTVDAVTTATISFSSSPAAFSRDNSY